LGDSIEVGGFRSPAGVEDFYWVAGSALFRAA
jgi:hypothetical protein